ncbi:hypothetical protein UFOVP518_10 [uncultured Caudovirales phage]|uniref:Uncharacterized protein n=1 Tax=uncultured Caudovirales phage TaxID=2100421 RepID=A0A6J5MKK2_9CAUD|nr:hypothetical protein UFOVP518_10 [uncultured Caudovirales phage]
MKSKLNTSQIIAHILNGAVFLSSRNMLYPTNYSLIIDGIEIQLNKRNGQSVCGTLFMKHKNVKCEILSAGYKKYSI